MWGRNFNASSFLLNYVIFLFFALLSSNCNAYPSLLTGIKGENKEKTSVTDALQNIIMRQFTLISECMSQKNSDIRNDILINKKTLAQTQAELMIMKEENKQLREQLSKTKIELSDYKATNNQKWAKQDTVISDINSNTKKFNEIYENKTQELIERLDKQDDEIDEHRNQQLKQDNINERLEKTISEVKSSHNSLKQSHQNETQTLVIQLKEQDDLIDAEGKRQIRQNKVIERLENIIGELKESHHSLKQSHLNESQKMVNRLKAQDDIIVAQSKHQLEQDKIIQTLKNMISELKEYDTNNTQELTTRLKNINEIHQSQNMTLEKLHGELKETDNVKVKIDGQRKDIRKIEQLFTDMNETQRKENEELSIQLKNQDVRIISQTKTLMMVLDYLKNTEFGTCRDILGGGACRTKTCRSGVYSIYVNGKITPVWCDMETDGGGWTVIQRRQSGNVDFYRTWKEYKIGFGNASDEYWIGNDALHVLTSSRKMKLRVDLEQFKGTKGHATFSTFAVANEADKYRLSLSGYTGDKKINKCLANNDRKQFSTKDSKYSACAVQRHGGWWYWSCTWSNLNGQYHVSGTVNFTSVSCWHWTDNKYSALKKTIMMIR